MKLKERKGFESFGMRLLYRSVSVFCRCRALLPDWIRRGGDPVIFVANHYNLFGPLSFIVSVPLDCSFWSNEEMLSPEISREAMIPGLGKMLPFVKKNTVAKLARKLSSFVTGVLGRLEAIPVDRHNPSKLLTTMRRSVSALEAGRPLLIFPETGLPEYSLTSVTPFFPGFAAIGKICRRKLGKTACFCPCYIDEQRRVIRFGDPVRYEEEGTDAAGESQRVSDALNAQIRAMAVDAAGPGKKELSPGMRRLLWSDRAIRFLLACALFAAFFFCPGRVPALIFAAGHLLRCAAERISAAKQAFPDRRGAVISRFIRTAADLGMLLYLAAEQSFLIPAAAAAVLNECVFIAGNLTAWARSRRCAGLTFYDTLFCNCVSLVCFFVLLLPAVAASAAPWLTAAVFVLLLPSVWSSLSFNRRLMNADF